MYRRVLPLLLTAVLLLSGCTAGRQTVPKEKSGQETNMGETGFREAVRVEYDPRQVSLDALLLAYFYVIDPTVENRQGNDRGSQYQR